MFMSFHVSNKVQIAIFGRLTFAGGIEQNMGQSTPTEGSPDLGRVPLATTKPNQINTHPEIIHC